MKISRLIYLFVLFILVQCSDEKEAEPLSADFSVSHTVIKVGASVTFTDLSTGDPNSWNWIFSGGEPTTSNEQNPVIRYNTPGSFNVSLNSSNGSSADTETKENFIVVEAELSIEVTGVIIDAASQKPIENVEIIAFTGGVYTGNSGPYYGDAVHLGTTDICGKFRVTLPDSVKGVGAHGQNDSTFVRLRLRRPDFGEEEVTIPFKSDIQYSA